MLTRNHVSFLSLAGMVGLTTALNLVAPSAAVAGWDYPLAAKLAMYDAADTVCRPINPERFDNDAQGMCSMFFDTTPEQQAAARKSPDYDLFLKDALTGFAAVVQGSKVGPQPACKAILGVDGKHL